MRKSFLKTIFFSSIKLCFTTILLISSCIVSPKLEDFLKDDDVQHKLETTRVGLSKDSDSGLIIGNMRIYNLNPNKYYRIKTEISEENEDGEKLPPDTSYGFIDKNGSIVPTTRTDALKEIGKVAEGVIIGLENAKTYGNATAVPPIPNIYTTYTVKSAAAMTAKLHYYTNLNGIHELSEDTRHNFPSNGVITAPETDKYHYLDLESYIKENHSYEIFIPDPDPDDTDIPFCNDMGNHIYQMSRSYNVADYLIVEYNNDDDSITDFRIITINQKGETQPDGTTFRISVQYLRQDNNQLEITTADELIYSQSGSVTEIILEVKDHSLYSNFEWYTDVDDPSPAPVSTDWYYVMIFDTNLDYQIAGTYNIYVFAEQTGTGGFYEAVITITVTAL